MGKGGVRDYSKKHMPDERVNQAISSLLKGASQAGTISCTAVFTVASQAGVSPQEAGKAVDLLHLRLTACQLGLFGYSPEQVMVKPAATVSPELDSAIRNSLVAGRLPCARAWRIAEVFKIQKKEVACAAEALHIRIKPCQLGAF